MEFEYLKNLENFEPSVLHLQIVEFYGVKNDETF